MLRRIVASVTALTIASIAACSSFDESADDPSSSTRGPNGDGGGADGTVDARSEGSTPCSDTASDSLNCGRCGHDCLGGSCVAGVCKPFEIGRTNDVPVKALAADGTRVYWMTSAASNSGTGALYACAKSGCVNGAPEVLYENQDTPGTLASDGTTAWASFAFGANRVVEYAPGAGAIEVPALSSVARIFYMETQPEGLYVVRFDASNDRTIFLWKADGSGLTDVGTFLANEGPTTINTFHASFTTDRVFLGAVNDTWIATCKRSDCDASWTKFITPAGSVQSMTNDDQRVYWIDETNRGVKACVASGLCAGAEDVITKGQLGGDAFTVSYSDVSKKLVILTSTNAVVECDPATCASSKRVLAQETLLDRTYALYGNVVAADDRSVFYVAVEGTPPAPAIYKIMRVAR